ncbi:MAG TPA: tRNA pseudouridine(55) synthase TruB [Nitrospirota bacterium]|nr:tRNA pseudouridine(55) synthase TruB [Nitrospirota bacterium]
MDGVININKPQGLTSHDVVLQARRITGEKRIGHTGTLDPLATGVLVLCLGRATRIAQYLEAGEKEYEAMLRLGVTTDTLDAGGRVLSEKQYDPPSKDRVLHVLSGFLGEIHQKPPAYSAIKINGVPSYRLAREGRSPELARRAVTVSSIEILEYQYPFVRIHVQCTKGTYIRSLCADIGEELGTGAYLAELKRTRSGKFSLDESLSLDELERAAREGEIARVLCSVNDALSHLPLVPISPDEMKKVMHGNRITLQQTTGSEGNGLVRIGDGAGVLLAIAKKTGRELQPQLVFS